MHFHQRCKKICELLKHMLRYFVNECACQVIFCGKTKIHNHSVGMHHHHMRYLCPFS